MASYKAKSIASIIRSSRDIDANATAFLISGDEDLLPTKDRIRCSGLKMLHELTSGLLDLDRIDHYRRDSYFSGMKFASNLNYASLLNGFNICYEPGTAGARHEVRLSSEAIGHALTLLHSKERLVHDCFENPDNIAYEVMLHEAFNCFCFGDDFYTAPRLESKDLGAVRNLVFDLLMTTDEELLIEMSNKGTEKVKGIVNRIRNRCPYSFVKRQIISSQTPLTISKLRQEISRNAKVPVESIALRLSKYYGHPREKRPVEWLHLDALSDENGKPLTNHEEYKRQIEHFKKVQDDDPNIFWLFTPALDSGIKKRLDRAVALLEP